MSVGFSLEFDKQSISVEGSVNPSSAFHVADNFNETTQTNNVINKESKVC